MKQMYRQPAYPMMVVAKCAAGLAIVLLLSLITIAPEEPKRAQPAGATAAEVSQSAPVRGEAHHRKVVDKRP